MKYGTTLTWWTMNFDNSYMRLKNMVNSNMRESHGQVFELEWSVVNIDCKKWNGRILVNTLLLHVSGESTIFSCSKELGDVESGWVTWCNRSSSVKWTLMRIQVHNLLWCYNMDPAQLTAQWRGAWHLPTALWLQEAVGKSVTGIFDDDPK